jgi:hypothetical protein
MSPSSRKWSFFSAFDTSQTSTESIAFPGQTRTEDKDSLHRCSYKVQRSLGEAKTLQFTAEKNKKQKQDPLDFVSAYFYSSPRSSYHHHNQ